MSFRDSLRELCHSIRAIPGQLGIRPYSVAAVSACWSGDERGEGIEDETSIAITEADGQPPKVRELSSEQLAVGGYDKGTIEVGPITPDFPGSGTLLSTLEQDPEDNTLVYFIITGPEYPSGQRFVLVELKTDRAFHYKMTLRRSSDS